MTKSEVEMEISKLGSGIVVYKEDKEKKSVVFNDSVKVMFHEKDAEFLTKTHVTYVLYKDIKSIKKG